MAYAPDGTVLTRTVAPARQKVVCQDPGCGHPRSEHRSAFDRESNDYQYGKCSVFECLCRKFLEAPEAQPAGPQDSTQRPGKLPRCQACGSEVHAHEQFGEECLKACEANWRELMALKATLESAHEVPPR